MKKDQFIVICADSAATAGKLLPTARLFAEKLRKGIILLSCSPGAESWIETLGVPYVALKGDWPTAISGLPTAFNAVLAIAWCDPEAKKGCFTHEKQILKNFKECKIGYLVVGKGVEQINTVGLTLNHQRESKEKLIWASYFARFFHSRIVVMHHPYKDAAFLGRWKNNMRYMEKIFSGLNIAYETQVIEGGNEFGNPDLTAIDAPGTELFIALVADKREKDLGDLFATPPELKLLRNKRQLPVLFLNQRDDLYILCD